MNWECRNIQFGPTWPDDFFDVFNLYPKGKKQENYNMRTPPGTEAFWKQEEEKDIFELYIPGYSKYDVSITIKGNIIDIVYSKEGDHTENCYSFNIDDTYELPTEATVKDGVLTIELYKKKTKELKEYKLQIN